MGIGREEGVPNMFGMTAATAWELEAERRVELASRTRPASSEVRVGRDGVLLPTLRRLTGSLRHAAPAGLKDLRT